MTRTLVLGATSTIARALVDELADRGDDLLLAARDETALEAVAGDAEIRHGVDVDAFGFDVTDPGHVDAIETHLERRGVDGAIACFGLLGDQKAARHDADLARRIVEVNVTGLVTSLTPVADHLASKGEGFVGVISSVAGDRGRASNYVYGAAKAGASTFAAGLRHRLYGDGVSVTTIKPGFVDTPMTYGDEDTFLVASPERVARSTVRAIEKGKAMAYVPWFWRPALWAIKAIPEPIFNRLDL